MNTNFIGLLAVLLFVQASSINLQDIGGFYIDKDHYDPGTFKGTWLTTD
jgi:hypothetical protein